MKRMWSKNEVKNLSKEVIESGQVDNAKPIYFHPIRFSISGSSGGQEVAVVWGSIMILNNSDTPLDTSAKLKAYLSENELDVLCSVDFYDSQGVYQGQILQVSASENIQCTYTKDGATSSTLYLAESEFVVSSDAVNRIN